MSASIRSMPCAQRHSDTCSPAPDRRPSSQHTRPIPRAAATGRHRCAATVLLLMEVVAVIVRRVPAPMRGCGLARASKAGAMRGARLRGVELRGQTFAAALARDAHPGDEMVRCGAGNAVAADGTIGEA